MNTDEGKKSPRTLADVSHLFFSNVDESAEDSLESGDAERVPGASDAEVAPAGAGSGRGGVEPGTPISTGPGREDLEPATPRWDRTRVFAITGGEDSPGKSTVAVNFAHALMPFGRVALFDADPRVPNARFFAGLPSWHYLSRLTGDGTPAPNLVTDSGLVVVDWSTGDEAAAAVLGSGGVVHVDVPGAGRQPLDIAVVDVPASRTRLMERLAGLGPVIVLVSGPGRAGFISAVAALSAAARSSAIGAVALVVNRAPGGDYARRFHAKIAAASERLLSVSTNYLGNVPVEPGLGGIQRDRGAVVASLPDSMVALALREAASNAMELARGLDPAARGVRAQSEEER